MIATTMTTSTKEEDKEPNYNTDDKTAKTSETYGINFPDISVSDTIRLYLNMLQSEGSLISSSSNSSGNDNNKNHQLSIKSV